MLPSLVMTLADRTSETPRLRCAELRMGCSSLDAALSFYIDTLGFRLELIMPADAPRTALISGYGMQLRLEASESLTPFNELCLRLPIALRPANVTSGSVAISPDGVRVEWVDREQPPQDPPSSGEFVFSRVAGAQFWINGRAGMRYRDLLPGRLGGRYIASHIRIEDGGPVPDYVHFHEVQLQLIYCRRGWVKVVYEDQGAPFVMHPGDCVLQPPTIRHRVLEASAGLEVFEFGSPAEHPTRRDHDLALPTANVQSDRRYGGQRFVHHQAATATWLRDAASGLEFRDLGIAEASAGYADMRIWRMPISSVRTGKGLGKELQWYAVLEGELHLSGRGLGDLRFAADDAFAIPKGTDFRISAITDCEVLELTIPA